MSEGEVDGPQAGFKGFEKTPYFERRASLEILRATSGCYRTSPRL